MRDIYDESLHLLRDLVGFATVSGQSNLELIEYVERYARLFHLRCERVQSYDRPDRAGLLLRVGPDVAGGIALSGHTDVVPVTAQHWQSPPFVLSERQGRFYGRGCADMKSFIATALACIPAWLEAGISQPIVLLLSYDEEIGCCAGEVMAQALKRFQKDVRGVIVGEPSSMQIKVAQKGIANLRTVIQGVPCHSSHFNQGVSAVHLGAFIVRSMEALMEDLQREGRVNTMFDVPYSTLHAGVMRGGEATNIMASQCSIDWEIRCLKEDGVAYLLDRLQQKCAAHVNELRAAHPDLRVHSEYTTRIIPALGVEEKNTALALCQAILPQAQGMNGVAYAAEAGDFQQAGFPTVICGPGSIEQAHQADEYIDAAQIKQAIDFMLQIPKALRDAPNL